VEVDRVDEVLFVAEAAGRVLHPLDLGVDGFAGRVGDAVLEVGDDVGEAAFVLLLSEEGRRRKLNETEAYKNQIMYSNAAILASRTDEDIKREIAGNEALLRAYHEAHKSEYEQIHAHRNSTICCAVASSTTMRGSERRSAPELPILPHIVPHAGSRSRA
jgi:hypothetical protein